MAFGFVNVPGSMEGGMTALEVRRLLKPLQDTDAQILLALEAQNIYPDYDCLILEDFKNVNQVDLFSCAVTGISQNGRTLECPVTSGMIPGSIYTLTDGVNVESVQAERISIEDGIQKVTLKSAVRNSYNLESCELRRTAASLDNGAVLGALTPKTMNWAPGLTWQGQKKNAETDVILNTTVANSSLFDMDGNMTFTSDGLMTLEA